MTGIAFASSASRSTSDGRALVHVLDTTGRFAHDGRGSPFSNHHGDAVEDETPGY